MLTIVVFQLALIARLCWWHSIATSQSADHCCKSRVCALRGELNYSLVCVVLCNIPFVIDYWIYKANLQFYFYTYNLAYITIK